MTDSTPISAIVGLYHEKYWKRDPSSWGSINDWDIYYIENMNGCAKRDAHRSLSFELSILLANLPVSSRGYFKAAAMKKSLENCKNDSGNKSLWENHLSRLRTLAIMDRVNKREIRSIAIEEEMERYKSEQASIGQKRPYEEEVPSTQPDKARK